MSFILDALRKSEHDRQRQTGPGLAEVPIAPAQPRRNVWATAAVALLIVNLIGIGVLLWRRASHEAPAAVPAASTAPAAAPAPAAPAAAPVEPSVSAPPAAAQASVTQTLPQPVLQPSRAAPAPPPGRNPLESEVSGGSQNLEAGMAARAASVPEGPPAVRRTTTPTPTPTGTTIGGGGGRYEAIPESTVARAVAAETQAPPPTPAQRSALPNADEVMASGGMPRLHLDLHVYAARPQDRFVFVNSHKYREGDTLQEGPVIEQITPNGAVLDYRGSRFMLSRD
jgi:general secretion pathway protein B